MRRRRPVLQPAVHVWRRRTCKTHLMHAIASTRPPSPPFSADYISSERFMNEMINAILYEAEHRFPGALPERRRAARGRCAVLAGKEGDTERVLHTFNALYESSKQIVLSSDRPPHEIRRSRSDSIAIQLGLSPRYPAPDLETRSRFSRRRPTPTGCPATTSLCSSLEDQVEYS